MARRPKAVEDRLADLEQQLTELAASVARMSGDKAQLDSLKTEIMQMRAELARRGVGPIENPGRRGPKLSPEQVSAVRRRNAAIARASKAVGRGQARVKTISTKRKLEEQASGSDKEAKARQGVRRTGAEQERTARPNKAGKAT